MVKEVGICVENHKGLRMQNNPANVVSLQLDIVCDQNEMSKCPMRLGFFFIVT